MATRLMKMMELMRWTVTMLAVCEENDVGMMKLKVHKRVREDGERGPGVWGIFHKWFQECRLGYRNR